MGANAGARMVLLTRQLARLAMNAGERGADLIFAAVASGYRRRRRRHADHATGGKSARAPFASVHIKAKARRGGDIELAGYAHPPGRRSVGISASRRLVKRRKPISSRSFRAGW